nr:helix-turn-helix transcriptional regulator [Rhizobium halophilum]
MLASEVGMSRSAFSQRFTERVGRPPLDYLTRWRMVLAQRKLNAGETVAAVASAVGDSAQSAFAHAFKRTLGRTPQSDEGF